jgi:hypothetical protein
MLDKPAIEQERPPGPIVMPFAITTWPIAIWPSMADAASRNSQILQGLALLGGEWLDFVTRRLKEDVSLPAKFAGCRSPEDMSSVYTAFWQKLVHDYWKEFAVLAKLGGDITAGAGSLQSRGTETAAGTRSP